MKNQTRRDFLKLLGAAAVIVAVPAIAVSQPIEAGDLEMEFLCSRLTRKFDRLSIAGRQRLIESFDTIEARFIKEGGDRETVSEVIDELRIFFQKRLAAQMRGAK